ncbi:MAG: hypothetical protein WA970_03710, partial [Gammaproteobacteria bacterium]
PPSPSTAAELQSPASTAAGAEADLQSAQREASGSANANDRGLFDLLAGAWDAIVAGAGRIGRSMAEGLLRFLRLSDFELGNKVGWLAGTIIFEIVLAYLTGPVYRALRTAKPVLASIIRLLDVGGEIFGQLMRLLGSIRRPLMGALSGVGHFLGRIPGVRAIVDRISTALRAIFRYGDEAAGATRRAARETVEETSERAARESAEAAAERARREGTEEVGERGGREAGEEGTGRVGRETVEETVERPTALAAARAIAEANDRLDSPVAVVLGQLLSLKSRYRWIRSFRARPVGTPGRYTIHMIASDTLVARYSPPLSA